MIQMTEKSTPAHIPIAKKRSDVESSENTTHINAVATNKYTGLHQMLQDSFNKDFIEQTKQMRETAKSLLTLQIAVPALFTAVLKLFDGDKAVLQYTQYMEAVLIAAAFICWMVALGASLSALRPNSYLVNPLILERKIKGKENEEMALGLLDIYQKSAEKKYWAITISSWLTFIGIVLIVLNLFIF